MFLLAAPSTDTQAQGRVICDIEMEEGSNASTPSGYQLGASLAPVRGPLQRSRALNLGADENDGVSMDTADALSANFLQVVVI